MYVMLFVVVMFFSSRRRHTRCALVTGVQTCALPISIHTVNTAQTGVARMNPAHKPFDDARVRKAMRMALDTEKLVQIAHLGLGQPGEIGSASCRERVCQYV